MAFKMRKRLMGLHIEVSDSNSKSPALKRPVGEHPPTHKDSPVKTVWLIRYDSRRERAPRPCCSHRCQRGSLSRAPVLSVPGRRLQQTRRVGAQHHVGLGHPGPGADRQRMEAGAVVFPPSRMSPGSSRAREPSVRVRAWMPRVLSMPRACVLSQQSHTMQAKALKNEPLLKGALGHHDPSEVILAVVCPVCDGGPVQFLLVLCRTPCSNARGRLIGPTCGLGRWRSSSSCRRCAVRCKLVKRSLSPCPTLCPSTTPCLLPLPERRGLSDCSHAPCPGFGTGVKNITVPALADPNRSRFPVPPLPRLVTRCTRLYAV